MIPLKLQIKNFLSYGNEIQTIDFGQYPLICLSGKNGHGKSALLDALTWALWGHARKSTGNAKADEGLLHLGQTQMMVCFDFTCNNRQYRIKREFMKTYGKPVTLLNFGYWDETKNSYISLSEKTIRDTQEKIEKTLQVTFELFINSAFLKQGHSNEFSKKSPKERKEVLGSILGLDQYEGIRKRASDQIRFLSATKTHLQAVQEKLQEDVKLLPTITQKLNELEQNKKKITHEIDQNRIHQDMLERELKKHASASQELALKKYHSEQLLVKQEETRTKLRAVRDEWKRYHRLQSDSSTLASCHTRKKELITLISHHQKMLTQQLEWQQELLHHKQYRAELANAFQQEKNNTITAKKVAIERIEQEKKQLEQGLVETQKQHAIHSKEMQALEGKIQHLEKQLKVCDADAFAAEEKKFEKRKEHYHRWVAHAQLITAQLASIDHKNKLVHNEVAPSCPLCEQNLSASRKRFLKNKFDQEIQALRISYQRLGKTIKALKVILVEQHATLQSQREQQQENALIQVKLDQLRIQQEKSHLCVQDTQGNFHKYTELIAIADTTLVGEKQSLQELLAAHHQELEQQTEHKKVSEAIKKLEALLEKQSCDSAAYEKHQQELATLEEQIEQYTRVQEQQVLQEQRKEQILTYCKELKLLKEQLKEFHSLTAQTAAFEEIIKGIQEQIATHEHAGAQLQAAKEQLMHEHGSLVAQRTTLQACAHELLEQQKKILEADQTIDDYQAIAVATGKDGIQALLIEDAIPEIEQEANTLLAKLTDNQTQLFIESLRDLKKGGTKETLDIKISDAVGIRPYELFSGGEAFRIDFALRIAISKLLARRAGTSLQTLIIDEGFGSQDEDGLTHIMDVLYKIQDDFAKVIIVSHLATMKNQFPVHFFIEKGPHGSMVHILEQG